MADNPQDQTATMFTFFNEVGIIGQLSRTILESQLPDGLILPHFSVCNHLIRVKDGQTPLALASAFQVPKTTMTHTLAGLEKHGFVELRPNPADGRSKCVWLTPAGRAFRDTAVAALGPFVQDLSEKMSVADVARILPVMTELRDVLDKMRDA